MKRARFASWAAGCLLAGQAMAIAQTAGRGVPAAAPAQQPVAIREIIGPGPRGKAKTPQYQAGVTRSPVPPKDWTAITVTFDSLPEWADEMVFVYYALLASPKGEYTILKGSVAHADVKQGRRHKSVMFVRPNLLERYGEVAAVAVEVSIEGKLVVMETATLIQLPDKWWTSPNPKVAVKDGLLLNKTQTPFAFVNYDDYETVK